MDSLSLADVFWSALVVAGVWAQVLDARARRRGDRGQATSPAVPSDVAERRLTLA